MYPREMFVFRDPYARIKNIILMNGYEDGQDQILFERVDNLTREIALEILNVLETRVDYGYLISQEELADFILSDEWIESAEYVPRILH